MRIRNSSVQLVRRLTTLAFLAVAVGAWATSYYVDFSNGSDVNNGTTTSTPWQHCPGDSNATNTPASTTLKAGDTVIFKGGVQYSGMVTITSSGTAGNPITFDGNSAGTFGTSQGIIDGGGTLNSCLNFSGSLSYLVINNLELRHCKQASSAGRIIYDPSGSTHVTVSNCVLHDAGSSAVSSLSGIGIWLSGSTSWLIENNLIYDCYDTAIVLHDGTSNITINNNEFHDKITWGICIQATTKTISNVIISNNKIHDIYFYDNQGPHTDYVFLDVVGSNGVITNTSIYNNQFYNNVNFAGSFGGTAFIFAENSGEQGSGGQINNTYIWNNLFYNTHSYNTVEFGATNGSMNGLYIYNNSFMNPSGVTCVSIGAQSATYNVSNFYMENNILQTSGPGPAISLTDPDDFGTHLIDYNCYLSTSTTPLYTKLSSGTATYYTWAQWQAAGYDVHGIDGVDPKYSNMSVNTWNMQLQAGSPCINAGATLGAPYNVDILGISRPQGSAYDMGAYEYAGGIGAKDAPTGLRIKQ